MNEAVTTEQPATGAAAAAGETGPKPEAGGTPAAGSSPAVEQPAAGTSAVAPAGEQPAPAEPPAPDYTALKLPDGTKADDPLVGAFKGVALDAKLSPEAAQSFIDKLGPQITAHVATLQKAWTEEVIGQAAARLQEWETTVKADAEIGGAKLDGVLSNVARSMEQFGNPDEIRAALNETGAGSNPVLLKWFNKMATALGEGRPVYGGGPAKVPKPGDGPSLAGFYDHPTSQPAGAAAA